MTRYTSWHIRSQQDDFKELLPLENEPIRSLAPIIILRLDEIDCTHFSNWMSQKVLAAHITSHALEIAIADVRHRLTLLSGHESCDKDIDFNKLIPHEPKFSYNTHERLLLGLGVYLTHCPKITHAIFRCISCRSDARMKRLIHKFIS